MTCGFRNSAGTDLENVFYSDYRNAGSLGFRKSDGFDLGNQFCASTVLGYSVGYKSSSGTDLGFLRGAVDPKTMFGIWRPNDWPWNIGRQDTYDVVIDWWKNWVSGQINSGLPNTTKVDGVQNDCIYRAVDSSYGYGIAVFVYNSLQDCEVSISYERTYHHIWHNNWCDVEKYEFEISPYCKGIYFRPTAGAGGGVIDVYKITASLGHWGSSLYEVCLGIDNDDNHDAVGGEEDVLSYDANGKHYEFYRG